MPLFKTLEGTGFKYVVTCLRSSRDVWIILTPGGMLQQDFSRKSQNTEFSCTSDWRSMNPPSIQLRLFLRNVSNIQLKRRQIRKKHISEKWRFSQLSSWTCFVHFCRNIMSNRVALTKLSCAECCARITVFHKLNGSESVAVGRYLMLVVWWWLNTWARLWRMVLTLAGRICSDCFTSLMVLFFPFLSIFCRWKLWIHGD